MERYLNQCLDSLLTSNIEDIEILVINDGSTDNTSFIAHDYVTRYPRSIRVIDKENGHYGSCINRGLKEAEGKYIKILDADDSFDKNNLESYIEFLKKADSDVILNDYNIVDEEGKVTMEKPLPRISNLENSEFKEAQEALFHQNMAMHAVAFKRELLINIHYYQTEKVAYTDQEWIFLPILSSTSFSQVPFVVYRYLIGREGQSVDSATITKAMSLQFKHFSKRLDDYSTVARDLTAEKREYAFRRMRYSMVNTFKCILFGKETGIFSQELLQTDIKLKNIFPELYFSLDEESLKDCIPFKFIRYWRKRYSTGKPIPIISIIKKFVKYR